MMNKQSLRTGVVAVESAIVLSVCVFLLLGFIETSLLLMRSNAISKAAQRTARTVRLSGQLCDTSSRLGPQAMQCTAAADNAAARACRQALFLLSPSDVSISIDWSSADHRPGDPVLVSVSARHTAVSSLVGSWLNRELVATVQTQIEH